METRNLAAILGRGRKVSTFGIEPDRIVPAWERGRKPARSRQAGRGFWGRGNSGGVDATKNPFLKPKNKNGEGFNFFSMI